MHFYTFCDIFWRLRILITNEALNWCEYIYTFYNGVHTFSTLLHGLKFVEYLKRITYNWLTKRLYQFDTF